jgi:hypothetical protein
MKKKEYTILGIISLLLVLTGIFFIYFKKTPLNTILEKKSIQETNKKIVTKENPVKISLLTENNTIKTNSIFEVEIFIDTAKNSINGADISLNFNPYELEVIDSEPNKPEVQIITGEIFEKPMILQNLANNQKGEINLSIGTFTPFNGKGVYGIIRFKALKKSNAKIEFNKTKTKAAVLDETKNYLIEQDFNPLEIKIEK